MFQQFKFEVIIKLGKENVEHDHLSRIQSEERRGSLDNALPNMNLFKFNVVTDQFVDIATYLMIGHTPEEWIVMQKKQLVTRVVNYQLIAKQLYKLGADEILCRCMLDHERLEILYESHERVAGGHNAGKEIAQKVLFKGLLWPSLFQDAS